jgi:putative transcriptional regulator
MAEYNPVRDNLAKRIAGEVVLSGNPGQTMRKWRSLVNVNQVELASELGLSPSVISDYETGRRQSPGAGFIKRYVQALLDLDESHGGDYIRQLARVTFDPSDVFLDIREFAAPVTVGQLCSAVDAEVLTGAEKMGQVLFGYTVVDSLKAILTLSGLDFYRIFGATSERALVFTGISQGRSPMIAVKISPFKPRVVILHGGAVKQIDSLAISLAAHEGIPFAYSRLPSEEELVDALMDLYKSKS